MSLWSLRFPRVVSVTPRILCGVRRVEAIDPYSFVRAASNTSGMISGSWATPGDRTHASSSFQRSLVL